MESLNEAVANQRLAVLCTYPLAGCGALEILDVVRTHQFALARRHGSWDVIETAGLKQAKGCDPETNRPSYSLFMERLHPEDRDRVEEILKRAVREKSDFEFDYRIVLPDGSIKFLRSVGEALVNPVGELEFIGTTMDVTGLKRAEEMELAHHKAIVLARCTGSERRLAGRRGKPAGPAPYR